MVKAGNIMRKNAVTMDINKGFKGALDIMLNTKTDYILITQHKKPLGIVTERDLLKKLVEHIKKRPNIKLSDVMSDELIKINPETNMDSMSELMDEEGIRHLPVMNNNKLLGIVTSSEIVKETSDIHGKNKVFTRWQNIQTGIILTFFVFLLGYLILRIFLV
ncbi:MAG: CBS domain-containing protein [Nanobdellota archaeon]